MDLGGRGLEELPLEARVAEHAAQRPFVHVHEVQLVRLVHGDGGVVVGHDHEGHAVDLGRALPVALEGRHLHLLAPLPVDELEGPRPRRHLGDPLGAVVRHDLVVDGGVTFL